MWYLWAAVLVWSSAAVCAGADVTTATTRAPPRTLDRQAAELAWRSWLQSPESGNQNAPPRRITTKSLFITPLVCPKGQRLDSNGCVQVVTVNKDEHERILLEQLNALFTAAPSGDVVYDYGDEEPGPLQLSIPIALDPQAQPLQASEPSAQAQEQKPSFASPDKKDDRPDTAAAGLVAELELLQLQHSQQPNDSSEAADILNHNVLALDKPKRGAANSTEETPDSDEGQKEVVYGHVNVDPVLFNTDIETETETQTEATTEADVESTTEIPTTAAPNVSGLQDRNTTTLNETGSKNTSEISNSTTLKKEGERTKLNPENEYADIGEAIKLISRYAEVTTDDNFGKDHKKFAIRDDSILGTRTKPNRRFKPKPTAAQEPLNAVVSIEVSNGKPNHIAYPKKEVYYRYPMMNQNWSPPADYPFRHIQDYWPGRTQVGGVYNTAHGNPRRHHHALPYNYLRQAAYAQPLAYPAPPRPRPRAANHDLYTLLGLRHWFSSEGSSKR